MPTRLCVCTDRRAGAGARHRHGAAVLGAQLLDGALGGVGSLLGVLQLVLHLAELGQVDSRNLLLQADSQINVSHCQFTA